MILELCCSLFTTGDNGVGRWRNGKMDGVWGAGSDSIKILIPIIAFLLLVGTWI